MGDDMLKEGFIICENEIKNQILRDIKGFVDYTFIDSKSLLNSASLFWGFFFNSFV